MESSKPRPGFWSASSSCLGRANIAEASFREAAYAAEALRLEQKARQLMQQQMMGREAGGVAARDRQIEGWHAVRMEDAGPSAPGRADLHVAEWDAHPPAAL